MSEKIYMCLLRLLAPRFYRAYGEEAASLVRDRGRDEQGFIGKIRLYLDLLSDLAVTVIRNGHLMPTELHSLSRAAPAINSAPSFAVVRSGLPSTTALLVGGTISLGILAMLSALLGQAGRNQTPFSLFVDLLLFSTPTQAASSFQTRGTGGLFTLAEVALNTQEKERVLQGAMVYLRESYVYPNVAQQMIDALLIHERNGDYEKETNGAEFATLITKHLQAVSHDLHLRVVYSATKVPSLGPPEADPNFQSRVERDNCAFRKVEILPHNLGYLKLDAFGPVSLCRDTAVAAMQFLAHVDGLIFDLHENQGGDPHMVSFVASYLFDHRTHLNDIYTQQNQSTEEFWTAEKVIGPKFGKKPVFVLISAGTFSGGEEFPYDLKNLKRAVLVGETTAGGAHLVMMHHIDDHFIIGVPFARPINPISKTDWEGVGVVPNVKAKAADALAVAERLAENRRGEK